MKSYVYGGQGRIGFLVERYCRALGVHLVDQPERADLWLLATPSSAVPEILDRRKDRWVIDLSGHSKRAQIGVYGDLTRTSMVIESEIIQNPGCFASSVIEAVRHMKLTPDLISGPVSITSIGGSSVAHRDEQIGVRLAQRLWDHPHVSEITRAIPHLQISHFVPVINHFQPHGICSVISGELKRPIAVESPPPLDAGEVIGTPQLRWSYRVDPSGRRFVLSSALDNLHFPAHHAARLAHIIISAHS